MDQNKNNLCVRTSRCKESKIVGSKQGKLDIYDCRSQINLAEFPKWVTQINISRLKHQNVWADCGSFHELIKQQQKKISISRLNKKIPLTCHMFRKHLVRGRVEDRNINVG